MHLTTETFPSPKGTITYFRLTNASGATVTLSTVGAGIVSIEVPDRDGNHADVVIGYADPADYLYDGPCAGKIAGRYANRIARGLFTLDGRQYRLAVNCGPNALHGGPEGFQNQIWDARPSDRGVVFTYRSADGEEGYPGNLEVTAAYTWDDDNTLSLDLHATTDAPTVVNLTNHSYFNLDGENAPTALAHRLRLNASRYLPTDDTLVPTGELHPVDGTPMDFLAAKPLGRDIDAHFPALVYGKGYDNCWAIDGADGTALVEAAVLSSDVSGRVLTIMTTQPAVQVYTGNWLSGSPRAISGGEYTDYCAVAIECQGYPDAPNQPSFPSQVLRPGDDYRHLIVFRFSTDRHD